MVEISTPVSDSLTNDKVQSENSPEDLSEEDQVFFASIHDDLNKIAKKPPQATLKAIIEYSRSL
jgi:hypothetical protein